jgi:hypothetical protein
MNLKYKIQFIIAFLFVCNYGYSQITEGTLEVNSSSEIKKLIQKKISYNNSNPKIKGYRIQLFNGSESGANNTRNKFLALFPNATTSVDWDSPEWKVRVGKYKTRLEVDKAVEEIKLAFGNAIVIEMMIRI